MLSRNEDSNSAAPGKDPAPAYPVIPALRRDFIWGVSTSSFQIEGATRGAALAFGTPIAKKAKSPTMIPATSLAITITVTWRTLG